MELAPYVVHVPSTASAASLASPATGRLALHVGGSLVWTAGAQTLTIPIASIQKCQKSPASKPEAALRLVTAAAIHILEFVTASGRPDAAARERMVLAFNIVRAGTSDMVDVAPRALLLPSSGSSDESQQQPSHSARPGKLCACSDALVWVSVDAAVQQRVAAHSIMEVRKSPLSNPRCIARLVVRVAAGSSITRMCDFEFVSDTGGADAPSRDRVETAVAILRASADASGTASTAGRGGDMSSMLSRNTAAGRLGRKVARMDAAAGGASHDVLGSLSPLQLLDAQQQALTHNAELRAQYENVVTRGVVTAKDFWDVHRAALIDVLATRGKAGLESSMPQFLRPDKLTEFETTFTMTSARVTQIFMCEPTIAAAYDLYVPLRMSREDFWRQYFSAKYDHARTQNMEGVSRSGKRMDVRGMEPTDFFEALRRGDIDLVGATASTTTSTRASIAASMDLVSTMEQDVRASARRDVGASMAGYGLPSGARTYTLDEREVLTPEQLAASQSNPAALREAVERRGRAADAVVRDANRYGRALLRSMAPGEDTVMMDDAADAEDAAGRVHRGGNDVNASGADDLPDLYTTPAVTDVCALLNVDVDVLTNVLRDGAAVDQAMEVDDVAAPLTSVVPLPSGMADPEVADLFASKPHGVAAKIVTRDLTQRAHDIFVAQVRTREGISEILPSAWRRFVLASFTAQKEVLVHAWTVINQLDAARQEHVRDGVGPPLAAPAATERNARLLKRMEADYDALEALKARVVKDGVHAVSPPGMTAQPTTNDPALVRILRDPELRASATAEATLMLNILQAPLQRAITVAQQHALVALR